MPRGKVVCLALSVLALAAASTSMAQQQNQQQQPPNQQSTYQQQQSGQRQMDASTNALDRGYDQRLTRDMVNMPKMRAHLTQVWQSFGMSAKDAAMVASAYKISESDSNRAPLLSDKSDSEIASMLQSALAAKNYAMADQLMINYERKRILPATGKSITQDDH